LKLSIIIVNYNVKFFLEQCLLSVIKATKNISLEVFVVDNNSVDGSAEMMLEKFPQFNYIQNKNNVGFSKANNQAIKMAKGEYVLLLNPDTLIEEDTLEKVVDFMNNHPQAGGLGVKMIDGKGNFLPESKRGLPTPKVAFYKIFGLAALFPKSKKFGSYHLSFLDENEVHEVDVLSGAFMLIRKKVLDEIGLLDETFFMYGEDIDLSYRIIKAGYKNYYFPHTKIIHYKGESTKKSSVNYVVVFYKAMVIFAEKHFSKTNAGLYSSLINFAIYFRASIAIIKRLLLSLILPFLDFMFILMGLFFVKHHYQNYTGIPYDDFLVTIALVIYALIWNLFIYLFGGYDKPIKLLDLMKGIFFGAITILVMYALLSENYRFSRAIILFGTLTAFFTSSFLRYFLHFLGFNHYKLHSKTNKRIGIVGYENEIERVKKVLQDIVSPTSFICSVYPSEDAKNNKSQFAANINQMDELIAIFNLNEIIFCAKDVNAKQIIHHMTELSEKDIEFKIIPPNESFIIGSNVIESSGDIYHILSKGNISQAKYKRNKRLLDFILSFIFIILFPITFFLFKKPLQYLKNLTQIFIGNKTFVGYHDSALIPLLPKIKKSILPFNYNINENKTYETNILYAKYYTPIQDISTIFQSFKALDRQT
jgi:O-antigen biosynthesis protein